MATTSWVSVLTAKRALYVPLLLPVLPLYPSPGLVYAYAGAVDGDGDWFTVLG